MKRQARTGWMLGALAWSLVACTNSVTAGDSGLTDSGSDTTMSLNDVTMEAASDVPDAGVCDLGTPPSNLPMVQSEFRVIGDDGGVVPTPMGGDPVGEWKVERITAYLPALARGQIDTAASRVTGTGWVSLDASQYRLNLDLLLTLETLQIGTIPRAIRAVSKGAYTVNGTNLMFAPVCSSGATNMPQLGFSRDAPDRGRLFMSIMTMGGTSTTMVLDLVR